MHFVNARGIDCKNSASFWRFFACSLMFLSLILVLPSAAKAESDEVVNQSQWSLWGTVEFGSADLSVLPKWQDVLLKIKKEEEVYAACDADVLKCDTIGLKDWRVFVKNRRKKLQDSPSTDEQSNPLDLLDDVNSFFNQWTYIEDMYNWDLSDYWASPLEFLKKSGDCEDYAIIKYITLKQLGFDVSNLRIAVVKDTVREIAHAVLAVQGSSGEIYILDSLMNEVLPQNGLLQYTPYYSVNEKMRWIHI